MLQGGVDLSYLRWMPYDGVGRERPQRPQLHRARLRPARRRRLLRPRPHRGLAAAARRRRLGRSSSATGQGARWLHTGGIFCALSERTPAVARAAMEEARQHGTLRLLRPQLPRLALAVDRRPGAGARGEPRADAVRRRAVRQRGGLLGRARLRARRTSTSSFSELPTAAFRTMIAKVVAAFPNITTVATTLRTARSATSTAGARSATTRGSSTRSPQRDVEILDRVGGGDSFASGFIYGLLAGKDAAVGARVRRRPRRAGDVHARRHQHGDARRGDERDEGPGREDRPMSTGQTRAEICRRVEAGRPSCRSCARRRRSWRCAPSRRCWPAASPSSRSR